MMVKDKSICQTILDIKKSTKKTEVEREWRIMQSVQLI